MNEFIIWNYFMDRGGHFVYLILSGSTPLLTFTRLSTCPSWPSWVGSFHHLSVSTVMCLSSSLTQAITSATLPSRFLFFSTYPNAASPPHRIRNCPSTTYWDFGLTLLKDSIIVKYSETGLPLFSYLFWYNYCLSLQDSINTNLSNII